MTDEAVAVVAAACDAGTAATIVAGLDTRGVAATEAPAGETTVRRAIVLLSESAVHDPNWTAAVARHAEAQYVPVQIGQLDARSVPDTIRALNWIPWSEDDHAAAIARIFAALQADLDRYAAHRALAAEAEAWSGGGRSDDLLIRNRRRLLAARDHIAASAASVLTPATDVMRAFVTASERLSVNVRRKRRWRWLRRLGGVLAAAVAVASIVLALRASHQRNRLTSLTSTTAWLADNRPDWVAVLASGTLLQGDEQTGALGRTMLRRALSREWSLGLLGSASPAALLEADIVSGAHRVVAADAAGTLSVWDATTGDVLDHRDLGPRPTALAATPDGRLVAYAAGRSLSLVALPSWRRSEFTLPRPAAILALAPRDDAIAIVSEDGVLMRASLSGAPRVRILGRHQEVLALRRTGEGDARALVRDGSRLSIVDATTGRTLITRRAPRRSLFERGALGPNGRSAALTGPDHQLIYAASDLRFHATGQAVPDVLDVLEVLGGERVLFGGSQFGVRLVDVRRHLSLGKVCRTLAAVDYVRSAADGDVVLCGDGWFVDLWSTKALSPLDRARSGLDVHGEREVRNGPLIATAGDRGSVMIKKRLGPSRAGGVTVKVAESRVVVVSVASDGRSVLAGTGDGRVVQLDVVGRTVQTVGWWQSPDSTAITRLGWTDHGDHLLIRTKADHWWSPRSCRACGWDSVAIKQARDRAWPCYVPSAVVNLAAQVKKVMRIHKCQNPGRAPRG